MKTIGLIGGMSWQSTATYYRIMNETAARALGGLSSARIVLYSLNFSEIEYYLKNNDWTSITAILTDAAISLENAGADFIVIASDTMHKAAEKILKHIHINILNKVRLIGSTLKHDGIRKVGLIGSKVTVTDGFYASTLQNFGIETILPRSEDITLIHDIIYRELCLGIVKEASCRKIARVIDLLKVDGAEAVILGATELGHLIAQKDTLVTIYDAAVLHAQVAASEAIKN